MRLSTLEELRHCLQDHTAPHSIVPADFNDVEEKHQQQEDLNKDELVIHALSCVPVGCGPTLELLQELNAMELLKFIGLKQFIFPADAPREDNLVTITADVKAAVSKRELAKLDAVLLHAYSTYRPQPIETLTCIQQVTASCVARKQLISKVKFIPRSSPKDEGIFGTFWRPNLLKDTPKYVDAVLDRLHEFRTRREDATVLTKAAQFWMTAAPLIRKTISSKRNHMSQEMKRDVMIGKRIMKLICITFIGYE
jgi:hypothetical protein